MSVDCDDVRMALGAYVLGSLDSREAAAVYEHLAWCPFCRVEADEFLGLPALLGRVSEEDIHQAGRPPRAVLDRMLKVTARRRRVSQAVLTIAASVVLVVLGGTLWTLSARGGAEQTAAAPLSTSRSMPEHAVTTARPTGARELSARKGEVHAKVNLRSGEGGTELVVALGGVPNGTQCRVMVVSTSGAKEQAASWTVNPEKYEGVATFSGSTAFAMDEIRRIDLVTPDDELLLRVPA
jgi:anti-sigma factor RsiW